MTISQCVEYMTRNAPTIARDHRSVALSRCCPQPPLRMERTREARRPFRAPNFFRRSRRGLRYAGPRLFTRAPSGLSLFLLRMAKLQATPLVLAHSPLDNPR